MCLVGAPKHIILPFSMFKDGREVENFTTSGKTSV